jgi:maltose/moltooligosaccharide transporter
VPGDVVKNAVCDVLVVQTSALDEERMFTAQSAENTANGAGATTGPAPEGTSPPR